MKPICLSPIGILHCRESKIASLPKNYDESTLTGEIEIYPEFEKGLLGITEGTIIVVLFWFHKARRDLLQVHPRGIKSAPKKGVFATRSPVRPNPVAISELLVTQRDKNILFVTGIDAVDGTFVLDIKIKK